MHLLSIISSLIVIIGLSVPLTVVSAQDSTTNEVLEKYVESQNMTDPKVKKELLDRVTSIIKTRQQFTIKALMEPCFDELDRYCANKQDVDQALRCLKSHRANASDTCEAAMKVEFGGLPLAKEMMLKGVTLPAGAVLVYRDKTSSDLDSVIYATIPLGTTAHAKGLVFGPGPFGTAMVNFSKFGLKSGTLAYPQVFDGIKIEQNIFFNEHTNKLETIFLAEDSLVRDLMLRGGSTVQFYPSGEFMEVQLADTHTIGQLTIPANSIVSFSEDGTIQSVSDDKRQPWDGYTPNQNQQAAVFDTTELEVRQPENPNIKENSVESYVERNTTIDMDEQIISQVLPTEWQLEGMLSLPHGKLAEQDIKLRVWTESGTAGTGHAPLWPIYMGENSVSFRVTVNGPSPQGYKLHYTCEQGCEGIVDAYYQTDGSIYDRPHAYTFSDGNNYTNISFPVLLGDTILGQIHLSSGYAAHDMVFDVYVDDVRQHIGRVKSLRIVLPQGKNSALFSMGLPSSSDNRWRFGISCDTGCESYLSNGYYYPNGLVQNRDESEIFSGSMNHRVNLMLHHKPSATSNQ